MALELLKGVYLGGSDCGEIENQECRTAASFLFTQLKIQRVWILAYLKKWYTMLHELYVCNCFVILCALKISPFKHINNLNSVHNYFLPNFYGLTTKCSNYNELSLLISYRGL